MILCRVFLVESLQVDFVDLEELLVISATVFKVFISPELTGNIAFLLDLVLVIIVDFLCVDANSQHSTLRFLLQANLYLLVNL